MATNSSCCHDFLDTAYKLNPDLNWIKEISALYKQMGLLRNNKNSEDLEAIGGGFNITLGALQDKHKRNRIVSKIREFTEYSDEVIAVSKNH